jgi:hypothetical protein
MPEAIVPSETPLLCPIDNRCDAIQSVPALVAAGRSSGSFSGPSGGVTYVDGKYGYTTGSTNLYGTLTSDLAQALAAPLPLKEIGFWSLVGWSWLALLSICIVIGPFLVWPSFKNYIAKNPEDQKKIFTPDVSLICILFLCFGWHPLAWPFVPPIKRMLVNRLDYPRRNFQWQEAYKKWGKLFYCHRCGIVFFPETKEHFSPNQLRNHLNIDEYEL